jgi:hypothetical protein
VQPLDQTLAEYHAGLYRCRCYRHFDAKGRSPGGAIPKGIGGCLCPGRRNWLTAASTHRHSILVSPLRRYEINNPRVGSVHLRLPAHGRKDLQVGVESNSLSLARCISHLVRFFAGSHPHAGHSLSLRGNAGLPTRRWTRRLRPPQQPHGWWLSLVKS